MTAPATAPTTPARALLLQRLADGDGAALDTLYRQEAGPVYRYALTLWHRTACAGRSLAPGLRGGEPDASLVRVPADFRKPAPVEPGAAPKG